MPSERPSAVGHGHAQVIGPDGEIKQEVAFRNLITDTGDSYAANRVAGESVNVISGMRLGTGTTGPAKNGGGAAIVTYISGSAQAIDEGFPDVTDLGAGLGHRVTFETTWDAGDATNSAISEVVLTNQDSLTDAAGNAANTVARALLSPVVNKGAEDSLRVTWHWDYNGQSS